MVNFASGAIRLVDQATNGTTGFFPRFDFSRIST
jgi:hypothetical protein